MNAWNLRAGALSPQIVPLLSKFVALQYQLNQKEHTLSWDGKKEKTPDITARKNCQVIFWRLSKNVISVVNLFWVNAVDKLFFVRVPMLLHSWNSECTLRRVGYIARRKNYKNNHGRIHIITFNRLSFCNVINYNYSLILLDSVALWMYAAMSCC